MEYFISEKLGLIGEGYATRVFRDEQKTQW